MVAFTRLLLSLLLVWYVTRYMSTTVPAPQSILYGRYTRKVVNINYWHIESKEDDGHVTTCIGQRTTFPLPTPETDFTAPD